MAVATASSSGYYSSPYYRGSYTYGGPAAYTYGYPSTYQYPSPAAYYGWMTRTPVAPVAAPIVNTFNAPLAEDSKALISAGVPRLTQAMAKLNELSEQLPVYLANIDPQTKTDIAKVNGIVNDICARAMDEIQPSAYKSYTPQGMKEMCDYIAKVGGDILAGLDNPAIFQKYTSQLQGAVTALNANAADLIL